MSTSSASSTVLSIVVASNGAPGSVEACLETLERQVDGAEVLVCELEASPESVRSRFSFARFLEPKRALVPELWSDGIAAAHGDAVALTISPMRLAPDWVATLGRLLAEADAVGGAIDPAEGLRVRDWAEYFSRYTPDMRPFEPHASPDLPGDNAAYRRDALRSASASFRDGFWEPEVHRAMLEQSKLLWHSPELVAFQGRSAGFRAFSRQRYLHGRGHGLKRGARFGAMRNLAGVVGAPLVPPLLTIRVLRQVFGKQRYRTRVLLALPLIFVFDIAWAAGEAVGHVRVLRGR